MDFSELKSIDLNLQYAGAWPPSIKRIFFILMFIVTLFLGYFFVLSDQLSVLQQGAQLNEKLKSDYKSKHQLTYNLEVYKDQVIELELQLSQLLKKLPTTHETPSMLDDMTFIATSAGLRISMIKWGKEVEKEFYTELPLYIDVTGEFHQLGKFVGDVAKLPRIVSLHEFKIKKMLNTELAFHVVAKTYRYKGK